MTSDTRFALPTRRCGGVHSAVDCPACILGDEVERLRSRIAELEMLTLSEAKLAAIKEKIHFYVGSDSMSDCWAEILPLLPQKAR